MFGWAEGGWMESRQRKIQFTAKTRLEGGLLHSHLHTKLSPHLHRHRSPHFLTYHESESDLQSFSFSLSSPPLFPLLLLRPPPFTFGQFFNLFEVSVDTQIKPLWPTRSSATCRQSIQLLLLLVVQCTALQCIECNAILVQYTAIQCSAG